MEGSQKHHHAMSCYIPKTIGSNLCRKTWEPPPTPLEPNTVDVRTLFRRGKLPSPQYNTSRGVTYSGMPDKGRSVLFELSCGSKR
ncbi:unnamed protein product [Callosobruchus maculatus]|uniref:Uncharacterized protein n=1 Tax=Callosobruchus maculatus TaxID=64391 RepID=A0A653CSE7_CALMS|nr:unnamed protein product [Callosobruchus maculatus]